jgi:hypothetical protein
MAKKFLTGLNLVVLDTDPATGSEGELYFNSSASVAKIYQAGAWSVLGAGDVNSKSTSSVYLVRNNTGSTILKGTLVSASGAEPSGRIDVEPFAAVGGINSELTVMGMATANISNGVNGEVISFGTLTGLDTRGDTTSAIAVGDETWAAGDILFAHPTVAGKLTKVRPQHDLAVAFITVRHASTGQIAVRIVPGNNHLEWMHDVLISGSVQNNEILSYDFSNGIWINKTADEAGIATSNSPTFTGSVSVETDIGSSGAYLDITNDVQTSIKTLNNSVVVSESVGISLNSGSGGPTKSLVFKNNGDLTFPDNSNQSTAFLGISSYSTTNISEGTNLYYTDERAQDAIGNILGSGLAYNDPTGVISNSGVLSVGGTINEISVSASAGSVVIGIPDSPIFVTPDIGVATATSINGTSIPSSKTLVVTTDIGSTVQAYDGDLASIAALTGTSGFLKTNGSGTWSVDTNTYSTSAHNHTLNSLSNVSINSLTDGQAIVWNSASSAWVNQLISGGGGATTTVSESAPATPSTGDSWYKPSTGSFFIYDGSYWVEVTSVITMSDEEAQDKVAPLFDHSNHVNITASYDDINNEIILTSSATPDLSAYLTASAAAATYLTSESDTLETVTDRGATSTNAITISNTTEAANATTGALIVSGGVGVAKDLWVDGNLHVAGTTTTENTKTVATHDNLIYLNAALDSTITNAVYSSGSITYTADNLYVAEMDIRITGVSPSAFNISSGDLLTVASATPTQFVVIKSDPGASYISGGTAHAKEEANPDLGFSGGYYDAGYTHAGLFRDASDGVFKFFQGYTPEPDEAVNIDTTHASFAFADIQIKNIKPQGSGQNDNFGIGYNATLNATGFANFGIGQNAFSDGSGTNNFAFGDNSMENNTGGSNFAFGVAALTDNTGNYNYGIGYNALQNNSGWDNYSIGPALYGNTGDWNYAVGTNSLQSNTGDYNFAFGYQAGLNNTGSYNVYIGKSEGLSTSNNIVIADNEGNIRAQYLSASSGWTLGTVVSGTWNGSTIGYQYGGTGLTSLGSAGYVLAVNGTATGLEWIEVTGGGSSFTNSSELAALLSDETGSGSVVFSNSPTFTGTVTVPNLSIGGQALMQASTGTSSATSSFDTTVYSSAEFIVYGSTSTGNYVSKVLMLARGAATPVITEYAILTQGTAPTVTITPSYSAPDAILTVAVTSGTNIEIVKTAVSI